MPTMVFSDYSDYVTSQLQTEGYINLPSDTLANINTSYPPASYSGCTAIATDLNGVTVKSNGTAWLPSPPTANIKSWDYKPYILIGGQNSAAGTLTYSQTLTVVTVTHTAHGMTANFNGGEIYLTQSTGLLLSGWFTSWTYIDANTYSCVSSVSQSTSGDLGTNTSETVYPFSYTIPTSILYKKTTTNMTYVRKILTTGTKTLRTYFNSILVDAVALTTTTAWGNTNAASQGFTSSTEYYSNGVSATLETIVTPLYTSSCQLSVATTWMATAPLAVTYSNRN